jgi:probable phosphoglycerate mutase
MCRTRPPAAAFAGAAGLDPDGVTLDEGWVEASFGAWENLTYGEVARRFPAELAGWQGSLTVAAPGGGDSLADAMTRFRAARRQTVQAHPGEVVLVVTHLTGVRAVLHEALDAGDAAMWRVRVSPAALTVVRYWPDGGVEVVTVNATAHLRGSTGSRLRARTAAGRG